MRYLREIPIDYSIYPIKSVDGSDCIINIMLYKNIANYFYVAIIGLDGIISYNPYNEAISYDEIRGIEDITLHIKSEATYYKRICDYFIVYNHMIIDYDIILKELCYYCKCTKYMALERSIYKTTRHIFEFIKEFKHSE